MRKFFGLQHDLRDMSPVLIPAGYTRAFIDGKIQRQEQLAAIRQCYDRVAQTSDIILLEGTGHTGVGSVVELNNAQVASYLNAEMILVANGGLGSAFDELELNRVMCKEYGVPILGVVLNKVKPDKLDMVREYFTKLLKRWQVPLLGVIPDEPFLGQGSLQDFEKLLGTQLIAGEKYRTRHYNHAQISMIGTGLNRYLEKVMEASANNFNSPLYVTHVSRSDIILGFVAHSQKCKLEGKEYYGAMILSGPAASHSMMPYILDVIKTYDLPVLHAPMATFQIMEAMLHFTPKMNEHDLVRANAAAEHYRKFLDIDRIFSA